MQPSNSTRITRGGCDCASERRACELACRSIDQPVATFCRSVHIAHPHSFATSPLVVPIRFSLIRNVIALRHVWHVAFFKVLPEFGGDAFGRRRPNDVPLQPSASITVRFKPSALPCTNAFELSSVVSLCAVRFCLFEMSVAACFGRGAGSASRRSARPIDQPPFDHDRQTLRTIKKGRRTHDHCRGEGGGKGRGEVHRSPLVVCRSERRAALRFASHAAEWQRAEGRGGGS